MWTPLWIYFVAPPLGMLLAGQTVPHDRGAQRVFCAKLHHHNDKRCIFRCNFARTSSTMSNATNHYDVIIIGTGAGGGTLAAKLAPTGKKILLLERGDYVPREKDNWSTRAVNLEGQVQDQRNVAATATARRCIRTRTTTSAATRSSMARRCSACAKRTSARSGITAASRPPGRSPTTIWNRTTRRPSISITSTASAAKIRPSRRRAALIRIRRSATSRASSNCSDDFAPLGLQPFHTPLGVMLDEKNPRAQQVHPLQHLRRASLPDVREVRCAGARRRPGARVSECHADDQRLRVERLETSASGREVTAVRGAAERRARQTYSADIVVVVLRRDQLRGAAAALGERPAPATASPTARMSVGRHYMGHVNSVLMAISQVPESDGVSEDAFGQRFLLRLGRMEVSDGPHLVRRQAGWRYAAAPARRRSRPASRWT